MAEVSLDQPRRTRVCETTGLALVSSPDAAFRIARESYGALAPVLRDDTDDRASWGRYDTAGRTAYAADERLTAFMEMLAPYRTAVTDERRALQPLADSLGRDLGELWDEIVAEWDASGSMKATWLPAVFREGRAMYTLRFPAGWWIDISATETIAALNDMLAPLDQPLTLSQLTSDDRSLTTSIATTLRETVVLDDGSLPLGVRFISKHGSPSGASGTCWAYWMRGPDEGLSEQTTVLAQQSIAEDDEDLKQAQILCKIKSR